MRKYNITFHKEHFNYAKKQLNLFFKSRGFKTFLTSFLTVFIMLGVTAGAMWHYRSRIFSVLATSYLKDHPAQVVNSNSSLPTIASASNLAALVPTTANSQETVVDVVKQANPAVVSITISEQVPNCTVTYNQDPNSQQFQDLFGINIPGFSVPTQTCNGTTSQDVGGGSGFIISQDGLIVTNRHVVEATNATYTVYLNNGKKYIAKVLARDPVLDVALIKITLPVGITTPYLALGDSDTLQVGQSVVAIGNALGQFKNSVSVGVVSGLSRSITAGDGSSSENLDKVIQTDAAINPGNSGGPLLDLSGNVIGINVAVVQGSESIGFALPINSVKADINSVKKTGVIVRPYIGIRYIPITAELQTANNLPVNYGILVQGGTTTADSLAVIPGSPADKAGIVANDIITAINGQKITSDNDFANIIRGKKVGDTITLQVISKGVTKTVNVTLAQAPETLQ